MTFSRLLGRKLNIIRRLNSEIIESQHFEAEILQKLENVEKLSIRELRELRESVQGGNDQTGVDESMAAENLGYFHMKDDRMAKVDPER